MSEDKYMDFNLSRALLAALLAGSLLSLPAASGVGDSEGGFGDHIGALTGFAPRLAGTRAENLASDYIENELESYGLSVEVDSFDIDNAFVYRGAELDVLSPSNENLEFSLMVRSPPTDGAVIGELVYLENVPEDPSSLDGEVVLSERGNLKKIMEGEPGAVITYRENRPAWSNVFPPGALSSPVFTVSSGTAGHLIDLQDESRVEVRARLESTIEDRTSRNVVATLPGDSNETVIVAAYHDSVATPGAVDGASAVSVMLEVARELSGEKLGRTVKFISFGSEEYGLVGSHNYVKDTETSEVVAVLDLGPVCPGPGGGLEVGLEEDSDMGSTPWLGDYVRDIAGESDLEPESGDLDELMAYSDYHSFVRQGAPAIWIYWTSGRDGQPLWPSHTIEDSVDSIDEARLEQTRQLVASSVRELSDEDLDDWLWGYRFPERFSVFTVLTSVVFVLTMAFTGYLRYVRGRKDRGLIAKAALVDLTAIFILYLVLLSGAVQVF